MNNKKNLSLTIDPLKNFDWEFYYNYYIDLRNNGICSRVQITDHWLKNGINENRFKSKKHSDLFNNFDWDEYISQNKDLIKYNNLNLNSNKNNIYLNIIDHWIIYGEKQNRTLYEKNKFLTMLNITTNELAIQMFQYAFLLNISKLYDKNIKININNNNLNIFSVFNIPYIKLSQEELNNNYDELKETKFKYDDNNVKILNYKNNIDINGYFISYKYFKEIENKIFELYNFNNNIINNVTQYLNNIKKNNNFKNIITIHVECHTSINILEKKYSITTEFMNKALNYFDNLISNDNYIIIIICNNYEFIRQNFRFGRRITYISPFTTDELNLCLMTLSDHLIISYTPLSWWGAYLNKNPNKKIILNEIYKYNEYDNYFYKFIVKKEDRNDIILSEWIQL